MSFDQLQSLGFKKIGSVDSAIINETNNDLSSLQKDLAILTESLKIMDELIGFDGDNINFVETTMENIDNDLLTGTDILQEDQSAIIGIKYKYTAVKVITGGIICGLAFGSGGAIFGIVPALIAGSVGTAGGAIAGYFVKILD